MKPFARPLFGAALLAAVVASPALAGAAQPDPAPPAANSTTVQTTTTTTAVAPAGQSSAREAVKAACATDFKAQCPEKTGADLQACVRENFDKLGDPCKGAIMTMMAQGGGGA